MGLQVPEVRSGWYLSLYPTAGEGGGSFRYARPCKPGGGPPDPARSATEAARQARTKARRYCAANRLNRLGTLTYAGSGCHDPRELRGHVAGFFRALRGELGGKPLAYLWTAEWHKTGHGLHVHFAVGRYVPRQLIQRAWGRGFVHIKHLGDLPVGSTSLDESRQAARYLSKYVGKAFDERRAPGLHRYEVAQGFQPGRVRLYGRTAEQVVAGASEQRGAVPAYQWSSDEAVDWRGPPALWASWAG